MGVIHASCLHLAEDIQLYFEHMKLCKIPQTVEMNAVSSASGRRMTVAETANPLHIKKCHIIKQKKMHRN